MLNIALEDGDCAIVIKKDGNVEEHITEDAPELLEATVVAMCVILIGWNKPMVEWLFNIAKLKVGPWTAGKLN